jgi:hypothetical protein
MFLWLLDFFQSTDSISQNWSHWLQRWVILGDFFFFFMFEFMGSFFFSIFTVGDQNFDGPILILSQKLLLSLSSWGLLFYH